MIQIDVYNQGSGITNHFGLIMPNPQVSVTSKVENGYPKHSHTKKKRNVI